MEELIKLMIKKESEKIYRQNQDGSFDYFQEDGEVVHYETIEEFVVCLHNNKLQAVELANFYKDKNTELKEELKDIRDIGKDIDIVI